MDKMLNSNADEENSDILEVDIAGEEYSDKIKNIVMEAHSNLD